MLRKEIIFASETPLYVFDTPRFGEYAWGDDGVGLHPAYVHPLKWSTRGHGRGSMWATRPLAYGPLVISPKLRSKA